MHSFANSRKQIDAELMTVVERNEIPPISHLLVSTNPATAPDKIYRYVWRDNVFLLWDNRCMLHRGQPFDNQKYRRHMIRTTVLAA